MCGCVSSSAAVIVAGVGAAASVAVIAAGIGAAASIAVIAAGVGAAAGIAVVTTGIGTAVRIAVVVTGTAAAFFTTACGTKCVTEAAAGTRLGGRREQIQRERNPVKVAARICIAAAGRCAARFRYTVAKGVYQHVYSAEQLDNGKQAQCYINSDGGTHGSVAIITAAVAAATVAAAAVAASAVAASAVTTAAAVATATAVVAAAARVF